MPKTIVAIATASLALTTAFASAGELSFESRGYGGPLYVGPNFQQGGQNSPPVYGPGSSSKKRSAPERSAPKRESRPEARKAPSSDDVETAKTSPAADTAQTKPAVESEISSISGESPTTTADVTVKTTEASTKTDTKADATPAKVTGCKRYFPTAGKTLTVPCE